MKINPEIVRFVMISNTTNIPEKIASKNGYGF